MKFTVSWTFLTLKRLSKMGCGSSGQAVVPVETSNDDVKENGVKVISNGNGNHDNDDLPTMMLPETPVKPKPPIAFEIPLEQFGVECASTPPAHLQRLLQAPQADITLPDIEEKLAEADQRRQAILQQRAASAQKRTQKMMKPVHDLDTVDSDHDASHALDSIKYNGNSLTMPQDPGVCDREVKNIA